MKLKRKAREEEEITLSPKMTEKSREELKKLRFQDRFSDPSPLYDKNLSDEDFNRLLNQHKKRFGTQVGLGVGAAGLLLHGIHNRKYFLKNPSESLMNKAKSATKMGLVSALGGTAVGYLSSVREQNRRKSDRKKLLSGERYDELEKKAERVNDIRKVAEGKMTADEFGKRWYKD